MIALPAALALAWAATAHAQASGSSQPASTAGGGDHAVVVTARRPQTQTLIDRKVYTVTQNLQSATGSAADLLNTVPSVNVDPDGVVSLRGDTNITILVDGKPSAEFQGAAQGLSLLQFPASDIDRIEVLTSPPAQFKAEGSAGVINIITKKTRQPGLSGVARASVGDHGRFLLGLDGSYNAGKLALSGGVGLRLDVRERLTTTRRLETDPTTGLVTASTESIDEHFHRLTPSAKAAVDYELNSRQSVGAAFSLHLLTGPRDFVQVDASGAPNAPATSITGRLSDGHELHIDASEGVHFEQKLRRPGETLALALQRSTTYESEGYAYTNSFALPPGAAAFSDLHLGLDFSKNELSADYDLPLPRDREIKLGYDFEADDNGFDNFGDNIDPISGKPIVDPTVTNAFHYRQQVSALYGEYQAALGPWDLQAGVRAEAARAAWLLITGDIPGGRSDFGVYPSLHLERGLGANGKIMASISRRITRPDPEALNPFTDHQDTHNLRAGDPNLLPQDTWDFELGYVSTTKPLTYGATAYFRIDRDSVTDIIQPLSADVVLDTKANLPVSRSAGLDFSADGKLGRKLSYDLSGNVFYTEIDAALLGAPGLRSTIGVDLKASLDYRPTPPDTVQISFIRTDRRLTPQGYVSAIDLVNLGYRHEFRPNLSLVATVSDLFDGQRYQRLISTPGLVDDYVRHQFGRVVFVGFIYTFGGPSKAKSNGFDYE